jgi:hypothetical protein
MTLFDPFPACADFDALYGHFIGGKEGADDDSGFGTADY